VRPLGSPRTLRRERCRSGNVGILRLSSDSSGAVIQQEALLTHLLGLLGDRLNVLLMACVERGKLRFAQRHFIAEKRAIERTERATARHRRVRREKCVDRHVDEGRAQATCDITIGIEDELWRGGAGQRNGRGGRGRNAMIHPVV
jgi:hypothetical protein